MFISGESLQVELCETQINRLKSTGRTDIKRLDSKGLVVFLLLSVYPKGLYLKDIENVLCCKNKNPVLCGEGIAKTLRSLVDNNLIDVLNMGRGRRLYMATKVDVKSPFRFNINFSVVRDCILGAINTDILKVYVYMKFLNNKQLREANANTDGLLTNLGVISRDLNLTEDMTHLALSILERRGYIFKQEDKYDTSRLVYNVS